MNKERTVAKNGRKHLVGVCVLLLLIASLLWATARPAPVRADDFGECVQTYTLKASGQATEWNNAVEHAKRLGNDTSYIKVIMKADWTLGGNESGAGFNDGRLYIPSAAKISLDLNGCVLSRGLANAKENGSVLYVKGALQIEDSNATKENTVKDDTLQGGVITGGNTTDNGGAIVVAKYQEGDAKNKSGSLTVTGGNIAGNTATRNGGAIWVQGDLGKSASVRIAGGALKGNKAAQGGAIAVDGYADLTVSGGKIADNGATGSSGGGVALFGGTITVDGSANITGNKANIATESAVKEDNLALSGADELFIGDNLIAEGETKAEIGVSYLGTGNVIANSYNAFATLPDLSDGNAHFYAKNIAPCFTVDGNTESGNKYVVVNADGKLAIATAQAQWSASDITLSGIAGDEFTDSEKLAANLQKYNGIAFTYDGAKSVASQTNVTREKDTDKVIAHRIEKTVGGVTVAFCVYIAPVSIEQAHVEWNWTGAQGSDAHREYAFTGSPVGPSVTSVTLTNALTATSDYTVVHNNARITTTATSTVKGVGNYTGEVNSPDYSIVRNSDVTYTVAWQKREDVRTNNGQIEYQWKDFTIGGGVTYADGLNYGGYLRAKLTVGATDYVEYVYAEGNNPFPNGKPDDLDVSDADHKITLDQYSADLTLAFTRGNDNVTTVVDAASYAVTIQGKGSCAFGAGDNSAELTVHKKTLSVSQANFAHWKLYFGNVADKTYVTGADETATDGIVEGDGSTKYVADNKLQTMESGTNYVWYRNTGMRMVLDGTTVIPPATTKADGATSEYLMDYLRLAEIAVSNSVFVPSVTSGETSVADSEPQGTWDPAESVLHPGINEYTRYKTTVTVTYNANYTVTGITPAESGESVITVTAEWAAVTKPNSIAAQGGAAAGNALAWVYGEHNAPQFSTERGDTVIFTFTDSENAAETTVRFAQVHNGSSNVYYEVKEVDSQYVADTDKRLTVGYYADYLNRLAAGTCVMTVSAPDYVGEKSVVAYGIPQTYTVTVSPRKLTDRDETPIRLLQLRVPYNGEENNTPEIELALQINGHVFVEGVDYELVSSRVEVGVANLTVRGIGSLSGEITVENAYEIAKAENRWSELPGLVSWKFGDYDQTINIVTGTPALLDDPSALWFKITTDAAGENAAAPALQRFALTDGALDADTVTAIAGLRAGTYRLFACVDETDNYYAMQNSVAFAVLQAANGWRVTPSVTNWVKGKYNAEKNALHAESRFGTAHVVVTDSKGKVFYDSETGVNKLSSAKVGRYVLTASVAGTSDYGELIDYVFNFQVLAPAGIPWWGILLIVIGALGIVALVLYLLWKFGVFRIFNDKMLVKMRTEATVEATIAAVRASKANDEAKISIAKAEEADRLAADAQAKEEAKQKRAEAARAKRAAAAAEKEATAQAETAAAGSKPAPAAKAKAKPRK